MVTRGVCLASESDEGVRFGVAMEALRNNEPADDEQALATLRELADAHHPGAQYNLGLLYLNGTVVAQDLPTAVAWWKKAAEQGQVDAQYKLAHSYRVGRGVAADTGKAFYWYMRAAEQGDAVAQSNVGYSYAIGYGVQRSLMEAAKWYERAAEAGDIQSRAVSRGSTRWRNSKGSLRRSPTNG